MDERVFTEIEAMQTAGGVLPGDVWRVTFGEFLRRGLYREVSP